MKNGITITIKKRSQTGWLVWLLIMMPFFFGTLNDLLGLPWALRYMMDIAWVVLLLRYNNTIKTRFSDPYLAFTIAALKQEINPFRGKRDCYHSIKTIIDDDILQQVLAQGVIYDIESKGVLF